MKIETKFDIGQTVYWLEDTKMKGHRGIIGWIDVYSEGYHYGVRQSDGDGVRNTVICKEEELYGSLDEVFCKVKECLDGLREQIDNGL